MCTSVYANILVHSQVNVQSFPHTHTLAPTVSPKIDSPREEGCLRFPPANQGVMPLPSL